MSDDPRAQSMQVEKDVGKLRHSPFRLLERLCPPAAAGGQNPIRRMTNRGSDRITIMMANQMAGA
jgi:hypothetical protein